MDLGKQLRMAIILIGLAGTLILISGLVEWATGIDGVIVLGKINTVLSVAFLFLLSNYLNND